MREFFIIRIEVTISREDFYSYNSARKFLRLLLKDNKIFKIKIGEINDM
tara:strand:+ start:123 stop:269 length:147 start_codon:yes stop_codon:yes gene_type:complete